MSEVFLIIISYIFSVTSHKIVGKDPGKVVNKKNP